MSGPLDTARAAWGEDAPEWVLALAHACEQSSQAKVAKAIGRSPALVSTVLARKYAGDYGAVEEIVSGVYLMSTVACPALGNMPQQECVMWRGRAQEFSPVNPRRVMMFRACNGCPRNKRAVHND